MAVLLLLQLLFVLLVLLLLLWLLLLFILVFILQLILDSEPANGRVRVEGAGDDGVVTCCNGLGHTQRNFSLSQVGQSSFPNWNWIFR